MTAQQHLDGAALRAFSAPQPPSGRTRAASVDAAEPAPIACVSAQVCGIGLLLPPKKLIGNLDRDFIAERQRGLQAYLDSVTQHPLLSSSLPVKKFLDPSSYSANYTGMFAPFCGLAPYSIMQQQQQIYMFTPVCDGFQEKVLQYGLSLAHTVCEETDSLHSQS